MSKPKAVAEIRNDVVYILQPGTTVYLKTADICAITGKSNQWIGQLANQGTLPKKKTAHGAMFDMVQTLYSYITMLESRIDDKDVDSEKAEKTKKESEAALKKAKATIATLDAKERLGQMHRSEDVAAMTEDLIYAVRGALLALPGRLAVDVMQANNSAEASEIIRAEVYKIMEELADYKYDSAKYQERVRERLNLSTEDSDNEEN